MKNAKPKRKKCIKTPLLLQLNWHSLNQLSDTSGTLMYTFEFVSHYRLSVASTLQSLKKYSSQGV